MLVQNITSAAAREMCCVEDGSGGTVFKLGTSVIKKTIFYSNSDTAYCQKCSHWLRGDST